MEENKIIEEKLKFKIALSKLNEEIEAKKSRNRKIIKFSCVACFCMILTTSLVFADEIENIIMNKFKFGRNLEIAEENGYVQENQSDFNYSKANIVDENDTFLTNTDVGAKVGTFFMDKSNISLELILNCEEINNFINADSLQIEINDLKVIDKANNILYSTTFVGEENSYDSGINSFLEKFDVENDNVYYIFNIYNEDNDYPESKELYITFGELVLSDEQKEIKINGNWQIELEVPEEMYSLETEYKVISCENKNIEVYKAESTNTGFEIGLKIYGLENPEKPIELDKAEIEYSKWLEENKEKYAQNVEYNGESYLILGNSDESKTEFYTNSEYKEMYENYYIKHFPVGNIASSLYIPWIEQTEGSYLLDSNGNKHYLVDGFNGRNSFNEDGSFEWYVKFDITEAQITDQMTLVLELYGEQVKVLLSK